MKIEEKFFFFDNNLPKFISESDGLTIYQLLKSILNDENENANIRANALKALTDSILLNYLKPRQGLTVLIDDWRNSGDIYIELRRLKDLFLYFDFEETEVENVYLTYISNSEAELVSEANFNLGLIKLQRSFTSQSLDETIQFISDSQTYFHNTIQIIENRVDARFFLSVVMIIKDALNQSYDEMEVRLNELAVNLFEIDLYSFNKTNNQFYIGIYNTLLSFIKINSNGVERWLDFRTELTSLFFWYSKFTNQHTKERLNKSNFSIALSNKLNTEFLEPFFALNFHSNLVRIDHRLSELAEDSEEHIFLGKLKKLAEGQSPKKNFSRNSLTIMLSQALPYRSLETINDTLEKLSSDNSAIDILNVYFDLARPSADEFKSKLIQSCVTLQGQRMYRINELEDDRNSFLANMLQAGGYFSKDQTRWSESPAGKAAGEIDIYVYDQKGNPYALIEALNLDSLKVDYLSLHLNKLFKYDTAGHLYNCIVVYSSAKKFNELWEKYMEYLPKHSFVYPLLDVAQIKGYNLANLKLATSRHLRENAEVNLLHIMIDMKPEI